MKTIVGLDLGTNSIGWAVVREENDEKRILSASSRILPVNAEMLGKYEKGDSVSSTSERTFMRGARRLRERFLLRRERLLRVLNHIGFLPVHYSSKLDRYGKFIDESEPKIAWRKDENEKSDFIFMDSFNEMAKEFKSKHGEIAIPYDWTLYYLRKKALTEKISKEELSWVLLSFLQKRGYNQTVGMEDNLDDDTANKKSREYFVKGVVKKVSEIGTYKDSKIFLVELEDGSKGKYFSKDMPDLVGQERTIVATMQIDKDGNDKIDKNLGCPDCKFSIPTDADWDQKWSLLKKKTEDDLKTSNKEVGEFIYDALLSNPSQKIKGKLVRVVEREFYEKELNRILETQIKFHQELKNDDLYKEAIYLLYASNEAYRNSIAKRGFLYLIKDDIIFYQRPLKVKKSLIADCQYEKTKGIDGEFHGVKCIARSHPLFEEFRLWQWLSNVKIYRKGDAGNDVEYAYLKSNDDKAHLFDLLKNKESIEMNDFLALALDRKKSEVKGFRWNYVEDKSYPCCNTRAKIVKGLAKAGVKDAENIDDKIVESLWQIMYSASLKKDLSSALKKFCESKYPDFDAENFAKILSKTPAFVKEYGSYSAKAIKKLLPLMRCGKYWKEEDIDPTTRERIEKILSKTKDETIRERVRDNVTKYSSPIDGTVLDAIGDFRGLPLHIACYLVYDRHSESGDSSKWVNPSDIDKFLTDFKQHSLNNPIVEQVTLETLRVVRDIWKKYGKIDEFHIELGRELKQTNEQRKNASKRIRENETANRRAKALLLEFADAQFKIEGVRPNSPSQAEIFRIFEDGVLSSVQTDDEITAILKKYESIDSSKWPTKAEVRKYITWIEQKYRSPYTGKIIPLSKLFTPEYQIEHVIPQARYYDDSYSNKVVCEANVNALKGAQLGYEFIKNHHEEKVDNGVQIFSVEEYENFVKSTYSNDRQKMRKLLADDIPDEFNNRKLNDTRYISTLISSLLSKIVREDGEDSEISKNIVSVNGSITTVLKKDWGMNDVWNQILLPRFERLNTMKGSTGNFVAESNGHRIPQLPLSSTVQKKRLDHRHHAMDAIVIACATRNHVNLLNNISAGSTTRYDLAATLKKKGLFIKPWETFTEDAKKVLSSALVSFKYANRILTKTSNYYLKYVDENGAKKKKAVKQVKGDGWAIRNSLHQAHVFGKIMIGDEAQSAIRRSIVYDKENVFDKSLITSKITDKAVRRILLNHLSKYNDNMSEAFSPEGIESMNNNIIALNEGIPHLPIKKVRVHEIIGNKLMLGETGNKKKKLVKGDEGFNAYLGVYENDKGERVFNIVNLREAIDRIKSKENPVPKVFVNKKNEKYNLIFALQPTDLVYFPSKEEREKGIDWNNIDNNRIYKFRNCEGGSVCYFIPFYVADIIDKKIEFTQKMKTQKADNGEMIKEFCVPIKINRLGEVECD